MANVSINFCRTKSLTLNSGAITLYKTSGMKKWPLIILFILFFSIFSFQYSVAQCSICTKTAQQLGEKPAQGLNSGILYLAFAPFAIVGFIGYRWWSKNKPS
jgi:hypothetical protein